MNSALLMKPSSDLEEEEYEEDVFEGDDRSECASSSSGDSSTLNKRSRVCATMLEDLPKQVMLEVLSKDFGGKKITAAECRMRGRSEVCVVQE